MSLHDDESKVTFTKMKTERTSASPLRGTDKQSKTYENENGEDGENMSKPTHLPPFASLLTCPTASTSHFWPSLKLLHFEIGFIHSVKDSYWHLDTAVIWSSLIAG